MQRWKQPESSEEPLKILSGSGRPVDGFVPGKLQPGFEPLRFGPIGSHDNLRSFRKFLHSSFKFPLI